ncbi:putative immunity protein [Mucilaginibacter limnophilus]|uniref:putative immunity protein n=1 Tax=Mucilaginibacter limnophilus TaxID=1932778 RepID=UPI00197C0633|nr:hypothetical protein [Mucilaginibacter limnophilus]
MDTRPREAIEKIRAWVQGEIKMMDCRAYGGRAMSAARDLKGAPRYAAYAAGQAAVTAHVAAHDLGAAAYAIKAVKASVVKDFAEASGKIECAWQRDQLPDQIRDLVLDDQRLRNPICRNVLIVNFIRLSKIRCSIYNVKNEKYRSDTHIHLHQVFGKVEQAVIKFLNRLKAFT